MQSDGKGRRVLVIDRVFGWAVRVDGESLDVSQHRTKPEAIQVAEDLARHLGGEVIVQDQDRRSRDAVALVSAGNAAIQANRRQRDDDLLMMLSPRPRLAPRRNPRTTQQLPMN